MRRSELGVIVLVESEDHLRPVHDNRPPDQIGVLHHQIDRFLLRLRERAFLEDRAARAHEIEKALRIDVLFEKLPGWRLLVDVDLRDVYACVVQKTSGVLAGRSRRLRVKRRPWHHRRIIEITRQVSRLKSQGSY